MARGRRPRLNPGGGKKRNQFKTDTATYQFRQEVLQFFANHTMEETLDEKFRGADKATRETKRKTIYYWRKHCKKTELASSSSTTRAMKKLRPKGTATVLSLETDLQLVEWVNGYRAIGVPVSALMLHLKALDFAGQAGRPRAQFAASWEWRKCFMERHGMRFCAKTRQGQRSPEDSAKAVAELNAKMHATMHKLGVDVAYNADQTPIYFEYVPKRTVDKKGVRTVWVRSGGKDKERMTCMLLGDSHGLKCTHFS
ncbi:hypothetical protein PC129_g20526 [Phytophthora cactorum]|uniref:HTH CENPB-type domain-containing protein n=2 Tax=Phytophthora cactorum TaxID=29920 RepID=A0A8T1H7U7_9STRA|nr:hypothetical protein Pcac1_g10377 [Phytophthora cactorum]KAG2797327.1 hypothetical protein PC111_g21342 [Phytophthora cactorum]KAG2798544.1 hypothetical protein PC112_g21303 [Phytophthora cactorum]KAG2829616.1 hypothetical protein PC113_g21257 [Phytophthora cactorum]KAG2877543.1 hypothetical protein PC114_g23576 [Phytophthora cactorum]